MKKHKLVIQRRSAFNAIIILIIVASFFIVLSQFSIFNKFPNNQYVKRNFVFHKLHEQ